MSDVHIIGTGITRHGFFADKGWQDLIVEAAQEALSESGLDRGDIDGGFVSVTLPEAIEQQNLGPLAAHELGMTPHAFGQVVAACAGGLIALQAGINMILSGRHRFVLVLGVEKVSDTMATADSMLTYMDSGLEAPAGFDYVDSMAIIHSRYMEKYAVTHEEIASFAVQDRWYAARNPAAIEYGRGALSVEQVLASGPVSRPITRSECGKACDAASAVILACGEDARALGVPHTKIAGMAQATAPNFFGNKIGYPERVADTLVLAEPTRIAAERAYAQAGIQANEVNLAQVHDCFTVMGAIHLEGLGVFEAGEAARAIAGGETALSGRCPANTDGGRIGLGHPTGATGINVTVETARQLQNRAGDRQVASAEFGACQAMGGNNATSAVAVLQAV